MNLNDPCLECEVVARRHPTSVVLETSLFIAHTLVAPCPLRGWLVLAPKRHARWWWELTQEELQHLGPLAKRIFEAQRLALGAEHGYALALGDALHHMHLHLVPRYADTPKHLRGRGAFDAPAAEALPAPTLEEAAAKLAAALSGVQPG